MSFDEIFDLTAGVYFIFYNKQHPLEGSYVSIGCLRHGRLNMLGTCVYFGEMPGDKKPKCWFRLMLR